VMPLLSGTVMTEKQAVLLDVALNGSAEECQVFTSALPPYRIVAVTPAWTRLCGYTEAEALGQTCKMLQGPATSPKVLEKLHSALREERPCAVRLLNYRKSGQPFINDLTVDPCCDVEGRITHFRGTLRAWEAGRPDVPRVYLPPDDETLVEVIHEEYPSTIEEAQAITNLPVVITGFQQPFRIIYVNNRWCQMWGFSVEEAIGRTCGILQGPGTCKMTLDALRQAALEQRPISVRLLNYTKDRRPVMNTLSVAPIPPVSIGVPAQHLVGMMRSHSIDTENDFTPLCDESATCNNAAAKGTWQQPTGMSPSDSHWPWASPPQLPMIEKGALQRVEQRLHSALERISDQPRNSQSYQPSIPRSSRRLPQHSTQNNQQPPQRQWQAHHAQSHSHLAATSQDSTAPLNSDYRAIFDGTAPVNMLVNLVQQLQVQQLLQQQQLLMQQQMFQTNPVPLRGKGHASDGVELALLIQDFEELNTQFELTELLYLKWRESANQQLASCWGHALLQLPWLGALEAAFLPFPRQTHCSMGMDDSDAASRVSLRASSNSAGGTAVTRRPSGANREDGAKRRAIGGTTRSGCCADSSSKGSQSAEGACSVNLGDESCHADMLPTWPPQQSSRHRAPSAHGARRDDEALESESAGSSSSIEPNTTNSLSSEPRDSSESMSSEPHTAQGQRKRSCDASESKRPSSRLRQMPGSQPLASKQSSPTEDQAAQPECHSSPSQQHLTSSEPSPREGPGSSPSQPQTPQKC